MTNRYFPDETITENALYFLCYMIERIARKLHIARLVRKAEQW